MRSENDESHACSRRNDGKAGKNERLAANIKWMRTRNEMETGDGGRRDEAGKGTRQAINAGGCCDMV